MKFTQLMAELRDQLDATYLTNKSFPKAEVEGPYGTSGDLSVTINFVEIDTQYIRPVATADLQHDGSITNIRAHYDAKVADWSKVQLAHRKRQENPA